MLMVKAGPKASPDLKGEIYTRTGISGGMIHWRPPKQQSTTSLKVKEFNSIFHNFNQLRGIQCTDVCTLEHVTCLPRSTPAFLKAGRMQSFLTPLTDHLLELHQILE